MIEPNIGRLLGWTQVPLLGRTLMASHEKTRNSNNGSKYYGNAEQTKFVTMPVSNDMMVVSVFGVKTWRSMQGHPQLVM